MVISAALKKRQSIFSTVGYTNILLSLSLSMIACTSAFETCLNYCNIDASLLGKKLPNDESKSLDFTVPNKIF